MSMKSNLSNLLLGMAIMDAGMSIPQGSRKRKYISENGNSQRTHKENVRRRKLRRITKLAKQKNRRL